MQSNNAPSKIGTPFASSGGKTTIPVQSQAGIEDGRASFTDGFPPLTRTPLSAGGVPPFGTDMNGILYSITLLQQWQSAGGLFMFDQSLSTTIGGYPKGAFLLKADASGFWQNLTENNTTNPDVGGAGWSSISTGGRATILATGNFIVPAGVTTIYITACGGGGGGGAGGGGSSSQYGSGGGGGGGGQFRIMSPYTVVPGQTLSISIGAAGSGGASSSGTGSAGGAGGSTSISNLNGGSTLVLSGGSGGGAGVSTGAGFAAGGQGGAGSPGGSYGGDSNGQQPTAAGGAGASTGLGGGGGNGRASTGAGLAGYAGSGYGSGGGGGGANYSLPSGSFNGGSGGNGAPGAVFLIW